MNALSNSPCWSQSEPEVAVIFVELVVVLYDVELVVVFCTTGCYSVWTFTQDH